MSTDLKIYEDEAEKAYRATKHHDKWLAKNRHKKPWLDPKRKAARKRWDQANPEKLKAYTEKNNRRVRAEHWGEPEWIEKWIGWVKEGAPAAWMMEGFVAAPGRFGSYDFDDEWPNDAEEWDGVTDDIIWAAESYGRGLGRWDLLEIGCQLRLLRDAEEKAGFYEGKRPNESMGQIAAVIRNGEILSDTAYKQKWREKQKGKEQAA